MSVALQPVAGTPKRPTKVAAAWLYRLSVEQYHQMLSSGILSSGEPVELLKGLLMCKQPEQTTPADWNDPAEISTNWLYRLSVDQYHQMLDSNVLQEGEPVELLEGLLVSKMGKKPRHRLVTELTRDTLQEMLSNGWCVESQEPLTTVSSEPEPDVAVLRGNRLKYAQRHPGPTDVGMLVEVSDTTLDTDRRFKKQIYAAARIPVYWIMNLMANVVEIYTDPTGPAEEPDYRQSQVYTVTDAVPVVLDGQEVGRIAVRDLLRPEVG